MAQPANPEALHGAARTRRSASRPTSRANRPANVLFSHGGDNAVGARDEAETFLDVPKRSFNAKGWRRRSAAILDKNTIVAKEMRMRQRVENALVRVAAACLPAGFSRAGIPVRRWRFDDPFRKLTP
jgi:hypothetical protein